MAEKESKPVYHSPACRVPTLNQLREISKDLKFDLSDEDLDGYRCHIADACAACNTLDRIPEPLPPVKYPRTPGYRPPQEENECNAWYWKCNIVGAPSGKLAGKRIAVKDNVAVAGVPLMNGSRLLEGYMPEYDAPIVTRILDNGGTIVGKAACEDFCFCASSFTSAKGTILNPHDKTRVAGGSSGGSAALLVLKEADMTIGGDQGGSIRLPSCACGVVGLKPTYGLVPYTGVVPIDTSLDHIGPLANTVYECALLLEAIAGYEEDFPDPRQHLGVTPVEYTKMLTGDLKGVKVGILKEGFLNCEDDVEKMVMEQAYKLRTKGANVEEVSIPLHKDSATIEFPVVMEGAYAQMMKGYGYGVGSGKGFHSTTLVDHIAHGYKTRINDISPTMKLVCLFGEYMSQNYNHRFYAKGQNLALKLTQEYNKVLRNYDVLIVPTIPHKPRPIPPPEVAYNVKDFLKEAFATISNTCAADLTGHPALNINAGFSEGLPVGMMMTGRHFDEGALLNVAYAFEQIRDAK